MYELQTKSLGSDLRVQDLQRRVWKQLFDLAENVLHGMEGDLFDDALFLTRELRDLPLVDRPFTFMWAVREMGTDITTLPETEWFKCSRTYQTAIYRCSVHLDWKGAYYMQFALEPVGADV